MNLLVTGELAGGAGAFWIGFLIDLAVKGTLLLVAACLLSILLRGSSPAARSRVWTAFFILLLLVPVSAVVLPPVCQSRDDVEASWLLWDPFVTVVQVESAGIPSTGDTLEPATSTVAEAPSRPDVSHALTAGSARGSGVLQPSISSLPWTIVVVVWLAGFAVSLVRMLIRLGASQLAVRKTTPFPADRAEQLLREVCGGNGSDCRADLRLTTADTVPYLTGMWRPALVLPAGVAGWPPDKLCLVLLHELAHLRRRDLARLVVGDLAAAVFWFHPLAWLAVRKAAFEQELACDEEVCRQTARGIDYARLLVSFASGTLQRLPAGRPGLASAAGLELRMKHILSTSVPGDTGCPRRRRLLRRSSLIASMAVFALCVFLLVSVLVKPETDVPIAPLSATVPATSASIDNPLPAIAIHDAAAAGDRISVARWIAANPELLNRPDQKGMTPLAIAAWNMHVDLVEDLLAMGADPDRKNNNQLTPLFCAMDRDRPQLTRILLDAGADCTTRGYRNWTLLHMAARNGDWETARILIDAGLDVNARDSSGSAPLDYVHRYKTEAVGRVLLAAGAETRKELPPLPNYLKKKSRGAARVI